jgi:RNA polymerase nonessential primary-like sigma factor
MRSQPNVFTHLHRPIEIETVYTSNVEAVADDQIKGAKNTQRNGTDLVRHYLKEIGRVPMLSREEEVTEARKVQQYMQMLTSQAGQQPLEVSFENERIVREGKKARAYMIQANLRLVVSVAKKYLNRGLELLDLIQEGNLGLERAVEKFDPRQGYRFSTYAHWWIRQSITRAIATQGRTIRLPVHITEKLNSIKKAQHNLFQLKGRAATIDEIAAAVESTPETVRRLLKQAYHPVSLDLKVGPSQEIDLAELIESEEQSPEEQATRLMMQEALKNLLSELDYRERTVIELRFGLGGQEAQPLVEVGKAICVSRERARQIEAKALKKLRKPAARAQVEDFLESFE